MCFEAKKTLQSALTIDAVVYKYTQHKTKWEKTKHKNKNKQIVYKKNPSI